MLGGYAPHKGETDMSKQTGNEIQNYDFSLALVMQIALGQMGEHFTSREKCKDHRLPWLRYAYLKDSPAIQVTTSRGCIAHVTLGANPKRFDKAIQVEFLCLKGDQFDSDDMPTVEFSNFEGSGKNLLDLHCEELHLTRVFEAARVLACGGLVEKPTDSLKLLTRCPETTYRPETGWFGFSFELELARSVKLILWYNPKPSRGIVMAEVIEDGITRTFGQKKYVPEEEMYTWYEIN